MTATRELFSDWSREADRGKPYRVSFYRVDSRPNMHGWDSSQRMVETEDEARALVAAPMKRGVTEVVAHVAVVSGARWKWEQVARRKR